MPFNPLKVGVIQATPALFDLERSVALVIDWIERTARQGCQLVLFPESFIPGYPRGLAFDAVVGRRTEKGRETWLDYWAHSLEADSPQTARIGEAVRKAGLFVALGVTERDPRGGTLYCSIFYFGKDGRFLGQHRKLKPTGLDPYVWGEGYWSGLLSNGRDL